MDGVRHADIGSEAFSFLQRIESHRDMASLNAAFRSRIAPYGYDHFIHVAITGPGGRPVEDALTGVWDPRWQSRYFGQGYGALDPTVHRATRHPAPFTWKDVQASARLTQSQHEFFEDAESYGGRDGVVTPLRSLDGSFGLVTVSGRDIDDSPAVRTALHVMSLYYAGMTKTLRRRTIEGRGGLTPRQRDIVAFIASGYTQRATADRLGLADKTVEQYLAAARIRLNVKTTAQLCVEAIRLGHIQI
ncbi:autoinducer binding domain-containing protein (plasmid) [Glycocaulis abyssi]|jgi:LuxR family transcriptional regulator, quorum-sensing system regulator BjaR1|uniref:Autoinducer binding domain-containing protein n=1 Tax=Glycocaulis abyssi TaxID=1433403 RepID=A0ABV9NFS0_9PROT|nr:LuxR family transcriptional regulator [Glycocaulis profundi]HCY54831.1 hypothetical protein [Oceanicaulis sp.]